MPRPALAVLRTREEIVDDDFIGPRISKLLGRGRQTDEIEVEASQQQSSLRLGPDLQMMLAVFYGEEVIDRISLSRSTRHGGSLDAAEGPVVTRIRLCLFPLGSRSPRHDPRPYCGDLGRLQRSGLKRHALVHVAGREPGEETTLLRLAGDDDRTVVAGGAEELRRVEAQTGVCFENAVTGVTAGLQDRLDLAEVIRCAIPGRAYPCGGKAERGEKMSFLKMHRDLPAAPRDPHLYLTRKTMKGQAHSPRDHASPILLETTIQCYFDERNHAKIHVSENVLRFCPSHRILP